jgi:DNA-binding response OmpR family regulator
VVGRTIEARSSEQALYLVSRHAVDAVITEIELPGMDGVALLDELRSRGGPPVIALLPAQSAGPRTAWLDAGGADCIDATDAAATIAARCAAVVRRTRHRADGVGATARNISAE